MPGRKRERFERSDVPRPSTRRNIIALVVLVLVAGGLFFLVRTLWTQANRETSLGDAALGASVDAQSDVTSPEGYVLSDDTFVNVLILTVDTVSAENPALVQAEILSLDASRGTGCLVDIPLDTRVSSGEAEMRLSELYGASGATACVVPLAQAANLRMSHVIIATDDVWDEFASYRGAGVTSLLSNGSELLYSITTDMGMGELGDVAELVQSIGFDNLSRIGAPTVEEDDGNGGTWERIDSLELGLALGLVVPSQ